MKKLRTYFNFANYDKIVVNWNIEKVNRVIDNGVNEITLPYLDLDFYENAVYKFKYYAVNQYGKSEEYEYTTSTLKSVNYITQIDVDVAPTLDSATIKWNAVHGATQYDVYIFHNGITTKITVYETQYIFKPSEDGYYSFAIGVNDVVSEKTAEYYLYKKPIIGTNTVPNTPSISATYNYDRNTRKATIDITLTHSDSSDVKGTYLTIQPSGGGKEIYYFPTSTPGATENVTKEYIVTANTTFTISAYSVSVDDLISAIASYNLTVVVPTSNPSIPANLTVSSHYDTNLQAPLVDIQYDAVSWEVPFTYEIAYSFDGSNWNYYTTNETSVSIIAPYGGITAYVKVRIIDVQGHQSGWSSVVSTTVANDTDAPATPTLVSTESLYGAAIIKVTEPTEDDFSHFLVTVNLETVRVDSTTIRVELSPGSTNVPVEIRAVDFSGNQSSPLTVNVSSKTLSEAEQSFADVQTDVANLQADVSGIQSDITTINSDITTIYSDINTINNDITTINSDISTIETILNSAPDVTNQYYAIKTNADGISTLFAKTDVNSLGVGETLYSKITQNASDISTLVAKTGINSLGETETLYSKITQNADSITSIVATLNGDANDPSQYSAIKQNATGISTIVATLNDTPDAANQYSSIKQNASEISNLVVKTGINSLGVNETLYSKITQNADSITSIVATLNSDANDPNQYSAIKQNASQISTVVADVSSIDSDLSDLTTAATRWSSFQQLSDEINLRVVAKDETGTPQATELSIQNGKIVVDATQFEVYGDAIVNGTLTGDKIQAKTISADKLVVQPASALPEGTIAYWIDSLVDVVNGIVPEGYTEINLAPSITLTPYNAPEGSVVGDLLAGNKIYAGKSIQVGNKVFIENTSSDKGQIRINSGGVDVVKIGEDALGPGQDGIYINAGNLHVEGSVVGDLLAGNKIYAGNSIQVGNKVYIENTSEDKGLIRVNSGGVDVVKIGEASTPKYYETCEIYVDVLGGIDSPAPKVYASLDGATWIEIGSTQNLNGRMTKVSLFSLQKEGTTLYLEVKTTGLAGAENGDINLYVDGSLAYTFHYSVKVGVTEEQIFTYILPSLPSDGISISGGLLETPQIVLSNTAGKILFTDSYWEITDGQVIFDYYTELTMNFINKYFDDKIIFFDIDNYAEGIRGFGLRFDFGGNTIGQIFNNDGVLSIGKYNKTTGDGPYIGLYSNSYVKISGKGLEIPSLSTAPSPISGMIYFNSTDKHFYGYNGSGWVRLD